MDKPKPPSVPEKNPLADPRQPSLPSGEAVDPSAQPRVNLDTKPWLLGPLPASSTQVAPERLPFVESITGARLDQPRPKMPRAREPEWTTPWSGIRQTIEDLLVSIIYFWCVYGVAFMAGIALGQAYIHGAWLGHAMVRLGLYGPFIGLASNFLMGGVGLVFLMIEFIFFVCMFVTNDVGERFKLGAGLATVVVVKAWLVVWLNIDLP